jgi:hypothetical protein
MKALVFILSILTGIAGMSALYLFFERAKMEVQLEGYAKHAAKLEAVKRFEAGEVFSYEAASGERELPMRTNGDTVVKGYVVKSPADALFVSEFNARMAELKRREFSPNRQTSDPRTK